MANFKIVHVDLDTGKFIFKNPIPGTIGSFVLKQGDVMTGFLQLHADPTDPFHAATKQYVDNAIAGGSNFLPLTGGTMTGPLILAADPVVALEPATKQYVDRLTFTHTQSTSANIWSIAHNKATTNFVAQVYIDGELIVPDRIVIVDNNNIDVYLGSPAVGQVNIVFWE